MAAGFPRERLTRLIDLASQPDAAAVELSGELADLLLEWPATYPVAMREPFEALLEKSLRAIGSERRAMLAARFVASGSMPVAVLNALFFDAAPEMRQTILARNAADSGPGPLPSDTDESALLASARIGAAGIPAVLELHFRIMGEIAAKIASDSSGLSLAVLCKGARLSRALFSAVAVLADPDADAETAYRRLSVYDQAPAEGAAALLRFWQELKSANPATNAAA